MLFRLLIDFDLIEFTKSLPAAQRRRLYAHFRRIQEYPGHYSDFIERDDEGRRLDCSRSARQNFANRQAEEGMITLVRPGRFWSPTGA